MFTNAVKPSEFELPKKQYELVSDIQQGFLHPLRAAVHAAVQERDSRLRATESRRAAAESDFAQVVQERSAQLAKIERDNRVEIDRLRESSDQATSVLRRHGVDPASPVNWGAATSASAIEQRVKQLQSRKRPKYWPDESEWRWGVAIGSGLLFLSFAPLVLTWPVVVYVWIWLWDSNARLSHARIIGNAEQLIEERNALIDDARRQSQTAIDNARRSRLDAVLAAAAVEDQLTQSRFENTCKSIEAVNVAPARLLKERVAGVWSAAGYAGADWHDTTWPSWAPDSSPEFGGRLGTLAQDSGDIAAYLPDTELAFELPALVPFSQGRCLLLETAASGRLQASETLQSVLLRILATTPAGKARFTFIDPIGLGQNVADFMALDKEIIGGRAWTEPRQISDELSKLTEHIETVIQKYLRRDFSTILEYNEHAREVAEPFRYLVVFDFPANFTEESARRLVSIIRTGPRCGVFAFIARDVSRPLPYGFSLDDLTGVANHVVWDANGTPCWQDPVLGAKTRLTPDSIRSAENVTKTIVRVTGEQAKKAMKVSVPFERVCDESGMLARGAWSNSSASILKSPIGPTGAREVQFLSLGEVAHHALIVGRTGSGKTNLMHIIISGLALSYSPDELQLFLVDLKGGVGFKPYADNALPHAAVIAIDSEREFAVSVLDGLDAKLQERFELFRKAGVDNIIDYRARRPHERLPRVLLIVDEYQEFFTSEDSLAQRAGVILTRIASQGRSFGIHILLATQSLAGAGQLSTATMGQIVIRVALPCHEVDARLIFADENSAARSLSRPGEAIYNDAGGRIEGNHPFQVAFFADADLRRVFNSIAPLARDPGWKEPVVFEGSEPATLEHCAPLMDVTRRAGWTDLVAGLSWLGEPLALLPAVRCTFDQTPGRHLLVVDREEGQGLGALHAAWISLLCQHRPTSARFYVLDLSTADGPWTGLAQSYRSLFDHQIELLTRRNLPEVLGELVRELNDADSDISRSRPPVYLLIQGLQRAKDLRAPDRLSFEPVPEEALSKAFASILRDGPEANIHVLAWCDTLTNARRALDRQLSEFGLRAAGVMSVEDSNMFLDCADAARLNRPHRMVFIDEARPGTSQKFRPYTFPDSHWLQSLASGLRKRRT